MASVRLPGLACQGPPAPALGEDSLGNLIVARTGWLHLEERLDAGVDLQLLCEPKPYGEIGDLAAGGALAEKKGMTI